MRKPQRASSSFIIFFFLSLTIHLSFFFFFWQLCAHVCALLLQARSNRETGKQRKKKRNNYIIKRTFVCVCVYRTRWGGGGVEAMRGKVASPSKRAVIVLLKEPNDSICARTVKLAFSGISLVLFFFFSSILAYLLFSFFASTCLHIWPTVILSLSLLFFFFFCSCHKLPLSSCKWRSVSIGRTGKKKNLKYESLLNSHSFPHSHLFIRQYC